jgi:hypothetical protein
MGPVFESVIMANLSKIGKKFYQVNVDVNYDKNILKNSDCVLGIFLKLIP